MQCLGHSCWLPV